MMKRTLLAILSTLCTYAASATYITIPLTGFTDDVVANGTGSAASSTTNTADGGAGANAWVFMDATYNGGNGVPTVYLPTGGLFSSASTSGLQYQLASYTGNNDLRLGSNATGTLTFVTPQPATELYLAAFCGNGTMPMTTTVNFTDGTTQVMSSVTVVDWFTIGTEALIGVGRANRTSNAVDNITANPRLHQVFYTINPANYSKPIQSITIATGLSTNAPFATLGVMAVSVNASSTVTVTPSVTTACSGNNVNFTANVSNGSGTLTYQWFKNNQPVGTNSPLYSDNGLVSSDIITVSVSSSSAGFQPATITSAPISITINNVPSAPVSISGPNPICLNSTNTYTAATTPTATGYIWTIPSGWNAPSLLGISITPTAGLTGGTLTVAGTNGCGTGPIASLVVNVVSNATPAVVITNVSPGTIICAGTPVTFTATPTNGGASPSYQWHKNGAPVGLNSNTYMANGLLNGDQITVTMTTSLTCFSGPSSSVNSAAVTITVNNTPPQPGVISGNTAVCSGTLQSYSIAAISTATSYIWTAPNGWNGTSTSPNINYLTTTNSGNVTVIAHNTCGNSAPSTLAVVTSSTPATPGPISGSTAPCTFSQQTYSIAPVPSAVTYNWTLPVGWSGGSNTSSISASTNTNNGNVTVTATNACGTSAASSLAVTSYATTPTPGTIIGNITPCSGTQQSYTVPAVPGATSYNWFLPNGWSGFSSTNTISVSTTTGGGLIQVSANNSCGFSQLSSLSVNPILSVTPSVYVSTPSVNICQSTSATFTANPIGGGPMPHFQWKKNGVVQLNDTNVVYTDNNLSNGDQISVVMISNAPCATVTQVTSPALVMTILPTVIPGVNINTTPPVINCAGTPMVFTSNTTGGGPTPSYQWYLNGQPVPNATGPVFNSSTLVNGDTLSILLTSSTACPSQNTVLSNKVVVHINPLVAPTVSISASPSTYVGVAASVTFTASYTGGGATPSFQWLKNGQPVAFATGSTWTSQGVIHDGDLISVRMVSYDPCANPDNVSSSTVRMSVSTGIANTTSGGWIGNITLYPNPSNGHFTINADWGVGHDGERVKVDMVNTLGQSVYHAEIMPNKAQWTMDVSVDGGVANGLYQLRVGTVDAMAVKAVMIQR